MTINIETAGKVFAMHAEPTMTIRFIVRDGEKILQQKWKITYSVDDKPETAIWEWRDVPTVEEDVDA